MKVENFNYKNYKQYKQEYKEWDENRSLYEAKKQEYLNKHPEALKESDIQRGHALLHAIDIMDEYSQNNAEDMEVATDMAAAQAMSAVNFIGSGLGLLSMALPPVKKGLNILTQKYPKLALPISMIPVALGYAASIIAGFPIMNWAAKVQVGASRRGRFEAMRKDLKDPKTFAVLDEKQKKEVEEKAKHIVLEEEKKKKPMFDFGIGESFSNLKKLLKKDKEYIKQRKEFENELNELEKQFDKQLSPKDIEAAKKDQQLLFKLVEKLDIASQDYSENIEMATNLLSAAALGSGVLVGWVANKAVKLLKLSQNGKAAKFAPIAAGVLVPLAFSLYSAKIQKQASRVGKFKAKQELLKDPKNFAYVNDKDIENVQNVNVDKKGKKLNYFKFFVQALKDNKEYKEHMKTKGLKDKKLFKAMESLEMSEEQIKEAKALQQNTFKTFNKVDEKSQTYAERIEALGQSLQFPISLVCSAIGMGIGYLLTRKDIKAINNLAKDQRAAKAIKIAGKFMTGVVAGVLPIFGVEYYTTKEQKKASRVADMLALKELSDFRHYVHYNNLKEDKPKEVKEAEKQEVSNVNSKQQKNLLDLLKK